MPYPEIVPYRVGCLRVDSTHELFVEECGRPDGLPVVFLHGGPGSGCQPKHRRYFDPARWRIVLIDQRGCGRSRPFASLENNTTAHLVQDLETVRAALGIERWTVFGVSWGSTLGLAYAEAHPERVAGLVVEGVFLGTAAEIAWWYRPDGVARFFPAEYEAFAALVPAAERGDPQAVMDRYFALMTGADADLRGRAVRAWSRWEYQVSFLEIDAAAVEAKLESPSLLSHSLFECHYFRHGCFLRPDQLLREADRLAGIPVAIVQSRYDMVCPPGAAWALHRRVAGSDLHVIPRSGHVLEGAAEAAVVALFDRLGQAAPADAGRSW